MADLKISDLTQATDLAGTEFFEAIQGGINKKVAPDLLTPFRGTWATGNAFPSTGGRFTGGIPMAGDMWTLTVDLSVGGNFYPAGTVLMALTNTPGQTLTNWAKLASQL